jgi:peptide alpha-N-acetyltransferase
MCNDECVGAIVCKVEYTKKYIYQGYIAMLAVSSAHRGKGLGILTPSSFYPYHPLES